jgi:hypothetical protein
MRLAMAGVACSAAPEYKGGDSACLLWFSDEGAASSGLDNGDLVRQWGTAAWSGNGERRRGRREKHCDAL